MSTSHNCGRQVGRSFPQRHSTLADPSNLSSSNYTSRDGNTDSTAVETSRAFAAARAVAPNPCLQTHRRTPCYEKIVSIPVFASLAYRFLQPPALYARLARFALVVPRSCTGCISDPAAGWHEVGSLLRLIYILPDLYSLYMLQATQCKKLQASCAKLSACTRRTACRMRTWHASSVSSTPGECAAASASTQGRSLRDRFVARTAAMLTLTQCTLRLCWRAGHSGD